MPDDPADPVNPETDPGLKAHIDRGVDDRLRDLFTGDPDAWSRLKAAAARAVDRTIAEDLDLIDRLRAAGVDLEALARDVEFRPTVVHEADTAGTPWPVGIISDAGVLYVPPDIPADDPMKAELLDRLARAMDIPPDLLRSPSGGNHWTAATPALLEQWERIRERADNTLVPAYTDDDLADLADTAVTPGRCTERLGVLWVDCTNGDGVVTERRAIPLTCTVVNPLPALPFDHTHVYWDPVGGLAVTRQADPQRDVDPKGCIRTPPADLLGPVDEAGLDEALATIWRFYPETPQKKDQP